MGKQALKQYYCNDNDSRKLVERIAEKKLLGLTEYLCEISEKQDIKFGILLGVIESASRKIIYQKRKRGND